MAIAQQPHSWAMNEQAAEQAKRNAAEAARRRWAEDVDEEDEWWLYCDYQQFVAWLEERGL